MLTEIQAINRLRIKLDAINIFCGEMIEDVPGKLHGKLLADFSRLFGESWRLLEKVREIAEHMKGDRQ